MDILHKRANRPAGAGSYRPQAEKRSGASAPPFDLKGFLLAGLGLSLLTFSLENADNTLFPKWLTVLLLIGGGALSALTVRHCLRVPGAVFDMSLLKLHTLKGGLEMILLGLSATGGLQLLLPVLFQMEFGMTPLQSRSPWLRADETVHSPGL